MRYRQGTRFGLSHKRQSLIYFLCINSAELPPEVLHKITNLCYSCGGEHYQALFQAVTTEDTNLSVALAFYLSEPTLSRLVKRFYQQWEQEKINTPYHGRSRSRVL